MTSIEKSDAQRPSVSVVIASIVGPPFIDDCLESIRAEAQRLGTEVIVVACGDEPYAQRLRDKFPWINVLHQQQREGVPALRRRGVERASGPIVAIVEEHCLAAPDWLAQALAAHALGDYAAVGGPVADHGYRRLRDWVVYFLEYNVSLPPAPDGETTFLNGANVAYRRDVLVAHRPLLEQGYWEASLNPALLAAGHRFRSAPRMVVHHRGPFDFGYYLGQRYWFSRAFAGARAQTLPWSKRLAYLLAAPVIPFLLLGRMAARVWSKRCHVLKFVLALPLLAPAVLVYVCGEWMGYLAGPGRALEHVE